MSVLTDRLWKTLSYFPYEVNNNMYLIAITIHIKKLEHYSNNITIKWDIQVNCFRPWFLVNIQ